MTLMKHVDGESVPMTAEEVAALEAAQSPVATTIPATTQDQIDALTTLLVSKGVITTAEVTDVKKPRQLPPIPADRAPKPPTK